MNRDYRKIYKYCMTSQETNAIKLVNQIMSMKYIPIHGPIHHFIVPAVLLTCYTNTLGKDKEYLKASLKDVAKRARIVPGGNCASCGACGAALGVGQFASVITENNPLSEESWNKVMDITSKCSLEIAKHGGPRCCKRDVYLSILTGAERIKETLGVDIKTHTPVCGYFKRNEQCRKELCLFYPKKKVLPKNKHQLKNV